MDCGNQYISNHISGPNNCRNIKFMMVSNCPRCQIVRGVKWSSLPSWCQMVLGVKLSVVSNGPRINISLRKCVGLQVILLNSTFQVSKGSRAGKCRCKISRKMLMNQIISQLSKKSPQLKLATCSSCGCKAGVRRRVGSRG